MHYHHAMMREPRIRGGAPLIQGTRVTPRTVRASLAEGATTEALRRDLPTLTAEGLRAVIVCTAPSAEEDLPAPAMAQAA